MQPPSINTPEHPNVQKGVLPPISIGGVIPYVITKRHLVAALGGQTSLVDRLFWASRNRPELGWLKIQRYGSKGKETLIWRESADFACERILIKGEVPPELPCKHEGKSEGEAA